MLFFIKKVILFLIPLLLIFIFPILVIYLGREYSSSKEVVKTQIDFPEAIFGFAYNSDSNLLYKKILIEKKSPEVAVVGTSKVLEIRKEFFLTPGNFINAGVPISDTSVYDMEKLTQLLQSSDKVKVLIIGIDQDLLYKDNSQVKSEPSRFLIVRISKILGNVTRNIYLDYFSHKYFISELMQKLQTSHNIGLFALVGGNGFRSDGSYIYSKEQNNSKLQEIVNFKVSAKIKEIKLDTKPINEYQKKQFDSNLQSIKRILDICKSKDIVVVGFMPPYPKPIYKAMLDNNGIYKDMLIVSPQKVSNIFNEYGYSFFDFSSVDTVGGQNDIFIDDLHSTDVMYVRMMLYISSKTKALNQYLDIKALKIMLENSKNGFLIF